jgi:DNA-3-methyladenine glycosylase
MPTRIPRAFFDRPTLEVARDLLGARLVRLYEGERLSGRIVEVEAYIGLEDKASHARMGPTARNAAMFGPPGHAYVYLIYGVHTCLNLVTEAEGFPAAVLVRALEPLEGIERQRALRGGRPLRDLTRGPGRLCQALAIGLDFDGADLCSPEAQLWLEFDRRYPPEAVACSPRVGVRGDARAISVPWRFFVAGSPWVSGTAKLNREALRPCPREDAVREG